MPALTLTPDKIPVSEVLRYLGHKINMDTGGVEEQIVSSTALLCNTCTPRYVYRLFSLGWGDTVTLEGTPFALPGKDIIRHLQGCSQAAVMAVTLGAESDRLITGTAASDIYRATILDACATAAIEAACDAVEQIIITTGTDAAAKGTTARFSPGYGDCPLDTQPQMLSAVDAGRKIGLFCSESNLLTPQKSVTAIVGIGANREKIKNKCKNCTLAQQCQFSREGCQL